VPAKLFSSRLFLVEFLVFEFVHLKSGEEDGVEGVKVLGKCLSRLMTRWTTPPLFFQLYFLLRRKIGEIGSNSSIMHGKAFCGNGIIHLNIEEFHEEDIGGLNY